MNIPTNPVPIVSIIMPAYNAKKYIANAIQSVIDQTIENWELLVIDDCSNDGTVEIIEKFVLSDKRIKLIYNPENIGVSETRNRGIQQALGEWIAFLDSDDLWKQNKLEKQFEVAKSVNAEFLFTGASYINEDGKPFKGQFSVPYINTFSTLKKQNVISCSSVLLKKYHFENIKMENDRLHEDYVVWLRILRRGICAYGINEPLLTYRISKNSKSGNKFKTLKMTYKVFRFIGINPFSSSYYTFRHILGSIVKYKRIFST